MKRIHWTSHLCRPYGVCIMVFVLLCANYTSVSAATNTNADLLVPNGKEILATKIDLVEDISNDRVVASSMCNFTELVEDSEFRVDSEEWKSIESIWGEHLEEITYTNRFHDIFLISLKGDILYTTARESDFGRNVKDINLENQGIHVVYDAIIEGRPSISYVEPYLPSSDIYSVFLANPVIDSSGKICGVFATQIAFATLLTEIYGEEVDFELYHVEFFNCEVIDGLIQRYTFRVKSNQGIQYFLISTTPTDGRPTGNGYDVGFLSEERPISDGDRVCSKWIQFDTVAGEFQDIGISEIYYHIWWKAWDGWAEIGIDPTGQYNKEMIPMGKLTLTETVTQDHVSGFCLSTGRLSLDDESMELSSLTLKIRAMDRVPSVYCGPSLASFVIVNPAPDELLQLRDSDIDGLSDYEEMYVTHTDPYNEDTDNDDLKDCMETSSNPNLRDTDRDMMLDSVDSNPSLSSFNRITETMNVTGEQTLAGDHLIYDSIFVQADGILRITDANLVFDSVNKVQSITVEPGGALIIERSNISLGSAVDWFVNTNSWLNWSDWDYIKVQGDLQIEDSSISCASILYVNGDNECSIRRSQLSDIFYAVRLIDTDAVISDVDINMPTGYGLFLTDSNPSIDQATVNLPIGYSIYCDNSSPLISDSSLKSNVDFVLDRNSQPVLENTIYDASKIEMRDEGSSLQLGDEQIDNNASKWTMNTALLCVLLATGTVFAVIGRRMIWRSSR